MLLLYGKEWLKTGVVPVSLMRGALVKEALRRIFCIIIFKTQIGYTNMMRVLLI